MDKKKVNQKNSFGRKLEQLMILTNVKYATIANELNYDVSYISKWITGKSIPSGKNIEKILAVISKILVEQTSEEAREMLMSELGVRSDGALYEAISEYLLEAYYEVTGGNSEVRYVNNAAFTVSPKGKYPLLLEYSALLDQSKPVEVAVMVDLFALDHVSKLRMAGIEDQNFCMKQKREDIMIDYIIDISKLDGNCVYDVILLIHMMTCYSMAKFHLYYSPLAKGKLLLAVKNEYTGITFLGDNQQFMCTTSTRDKRAVGEMFENICNNVDPDKSIFFSTDMKNLLLSHEYLQTLLSQDVRWLVGHLTEHFISPNLFYDLSRKYLGTDTDESREAERSYLLAVNMFKMNQIRLMIYNRALMNFVLSGELDFFNRKVIVTPEQRKEQLVYFREMLSGVNEGNIKMIREGFSDDFKYISNPCMFLSGSMDYLRLENKIYQDNLLVIKDESAKHIFDVFFEKIWNYSQSIVISDYEEIIDALDNLIEKSELLTGTK